MNELTHRQQTLGHLMQHHQGSLYDLLSVESEGKGKPAYELPSGERVTEFGFTVLTPDTAVVLNGVNAHPQCTNFMLIPTTTDEALAKTGLCLCLRVARSATSIEFIPLSLCTLHYQ